MASETKKDLELFDLSRYSSDVQTVMAAPPRWIIRWGITIIFCIILILFSVSFFVKYPDLIKTDFVLTSLNPSAKIYANGQGRIVLFTKDQTQVTKNEVLGYIDNPSNFEDVRYLQNVMNNFKTSIISGEFKLPVLRMDLNVGELQDVYFYFANYAGTYQNYLKDDKLNKTLNFLDKQRLNQQKLGSGIQRQSKLTDRELALSLSKFKRDSILLAEKIISKLDYENSALSYLPSEYKIENNKEADISNLIRLNEIDNKEMELKLEDIRYVAELRNKIINAFADLEKQLKLWENKYVFKAPIDGVVNFFETRSSNQYVETGKELFIVSPLKEDKPIGTCHLPVANSGKVKIGQAVNIEFANFPSSEYGLVKGRIQSISSVTQNGQYFVVIELVNGLDSDFKKTFEFKEQMTGSATIVTEDLRLIERFFNNFRKAFKRNN